MKRTYVKLKGFEKPTKESAKRAGAFMRWFGLRFETLRDTWLYAGKWDDEVATDTALYIYDCIALKGLTIRGKYKWYFLRAYHMRLLAEKKKRGDAAKRLVWLDDEDTLLDIAAPSFDHEAYEAHVDAFTTEMLDYVRAKYPPLDASLFEIYIALQPAMSYKKMGRMLGYPANKIWPAIGAIRRDLAKNFETQSDNLLTLANYDTY